MSEPDGGEEMNPRNVKFAKLVLWLQFTEIALLQKSCFKRKIHELIRICPSSFIFFLDQTRIVPKVVKES